MKNLELLDKYGLFDAKVPRYTSYPPANRFEAGVGHRHQDDWLAAIEKDEPLSIYVHIPFCRRLCWFCACRTQGTKTLRPVEDYVDVLVREIEAVSFQLENPRRMARLHLGGGTPTLLSPAAMNKLLSTIFDQFFPTNDFEFSVEIDPTEASDEILQTLAKWGLDRASIGVQDFDPKVQHAIGRLQSFEDTKRVLTRLRQLGLNSVNMDLLYGLPFQTETTLRRTLIDIEHLSPDRLALYGYAHVPHVSKRQVMIPTGALPNTRKRFDLSEIAKDVLTQAGYVPIGIDHFAKPNDGLAVAARSGQLKRNFQGYTDDPCTTLIGFGASAISKFPAGYAQNAVATAAYTERVLAGGLAAHRGYVMSDWDECLARTIADLMCESRINTQDLMHEFRPLRERISHAEDRIFDQYKDVFERTTKGLEIKRSFESLARIIAASIDTGLTEQSAHSSAI